MLVEVHSPSLISAAGQKSLCPLDKPHICGSSAGISHHHVGIQEENFTLVSSKKNPSKQTHPQKPQEMKNKKDKGTFTRHKQLGYLLLQTKGYKLFGGLLSLPSAARCKAHSSTVVSNKISLSGMQLWKYRQ